MWLLSRVAVQPECNPETGRGVSEMAAPGRGSRTAKGIGIVANRTAPGGGIGCGAGPETSSATSSSTFRLRFERVWMRLSDLWGCVLLTTFASSCSVVSREPWPSDLAREVLVSRQTMSALLRTLVYRGLAQRAAQAPSGRALLPRLPTKGRSLLKEAWRATVEIEWVMISPLSQCQLRAVQEAPSACVAALEGGARLLQGGCSHRAGRMR